MLFICRDAQENSVIGNVGLAMEAQKAGSDVAVVFTGEALAALAARAFGWSPVFTGRAARTTISRNATAMGIPVAHSRDNRWTDLTALSFCQTISSGPGASTTVLNGRMSHGRPG